MDNVERSSQVIYELFSEKFGRLVIQEPKNWSNDVRNYNRDKDSRGILFKVDIDLEFFGEAADYLKDIYFSLGIQEKVILTKYEKNDFTLSEEFELKYIQELDMGTFKEVERTGNVTVNSIEGGLYSDIKNRVSDEYDLLENTSADGVDIGELITNNLQATRREIFAESKLQEERFDFRVNSSRFKETAVARNVKPLPVEIIYESDDDIQYPVGADPSQDNDSVSPLDYDDPGGIIRGADQFLLKADRDKIITVKVNSTIKLVELETRFYENSAYYIALRVSQLNENNVLEFKSEEYLLTVEDLISKKGQVDSIVNQVRTLQLNRGDSVSLVFRLVFQKKSTIPIIDPAAFLRLGLNTNTKIVVEDITDYSKNLTITKCIKPITLFDRLIAKITGKTGLVKSTLFEKQLDGTGGEYEYMVIDNGLWARGFPNIYDNGNEEEQTIQIKTSFKEAFDSFNYIEPLVWFTEIIGNKEYLRIESLKYTQQNFIGISLGDVDKIEYDSSKIDYFSTLSLGHSGSMEYEELNGLDESNGKSEFTTFISKNDSKYEVLSKFRTDAIGYELSKRKPFSLFPKEDTKRDNDLFIHDCKVLDSGIIVHRLWQDIFDERPIGIYKPDSSWNLWLSPMNRLYYGHGYSVKRGLYHYPDKFIKFNSSNANENLITTINGVTLKENGSLKISDIENSRIEATMINLTFSMTQELENAFKAKKTINNKQVDNYFGLIEYNEKGVKKYGRLVKLDGSEEAKLTLIKARV